MIKKGLAVARGKDSATVAQVAARRALAQHPSPQIGILFASMVFDPTIVFQTLRNELGNIPLFGTTSPLGISNRGVEQDAVVLLLLSSDELEFRIVAGKCDGNPNEVGRYLGSKYLLDAPGHPNQQLVCITSSSQRHGRAGEYLRGLNEVFPFRLPVVGGATVGTFPSDALEELHNGVQFCGDLVGRDFLNFLFLREKQPGTVSFGFALESGCEPVAHPVVCTKTERNRVFEVDGIPIFQYLQTYLGDGFEDLIFFARSRFSFIARLQEGGLEKPVIRVPFQIDRERPSIIFWPEEDYAGKEIQLVQLCREDLLEGAERAASDAVAALDGCRPELVMVFSCTVRSLRLHSLADEEIARVRKVVGNDVPIVGMYCNAEFGPIYHRYREVIDKKRTLSGTQEHGGSISVLAIASKSGSPAGIDYRQIIVDHRREDDEREPPPLEERVFRLSEQLREAEARLTENEKTLRYLNNEHFKANVELRSRNELLTESNQRNEKLQQVIRQYTPHDVWRKASATVMAGLYKIPDEELFAAFMFMDVKGFTSFAEKHSPAEVISNLNRIFQPATDLIYEAGGDIDKFIGDCIFAKFPTAEAALRTAAKIQRFMAGLDRESCPFTVRIGLNHGRVVSGNVGGTTRRENALIGDAVNLTQRLESACTPGSVLVSADFFNQLPATLKQNLALSPRGIKVKGKEQEIEVYEFSPEAISRLA